MDNIKTYNGIIFCGPNWKNEDDLNKRTELLIQLGCYSIINLLEEDYITFGDEEKSKFKVINYSIEDFDVPSDIESFHYLMEQLDFLVKFDAKPFIHCQGGHGRTGLVLACLLKKSFNMTSEEALKITKDVCDGPETFGQINFVKNYIPE